MLMHFLWVSLQKNGAFRNNSVAIINVVFGGICWLALGACVVMYLHRTHKAHRLGKKW